MRKLMIIMLSIFMIACLCCCGNSQETQEATDNETAVNTEPTAEYDFSICGQFKNDRAWVNYSDSSDSKCYGFIDPEFRLIYSYAATEAEVGDFQEDGYSYICTEDESIIVDKDGNETYSTTNTDDTQYIICGHGDGKFLLVKHVSNMYEDGFTFSTIDENGNEIDPEQEIDAKWFDSYYTHFKYHGEGIFTNEGCLYNSRTNSIYKVDMHFLTDFENGEAIAFAHKITKVTPSVFASEETYDEMVIEITNSDGPLVFTPEVNMPDSVDVESVAHGRGEYYPVMLRGADDIAYFTIVDDKGDKQYEPVEVHFTPFNQTPSNTEEWTRVHYYNGVVAYDDHEKGPRVIYSDGTAKEITGYSDTSRDIIGIDQSFVYMCNDLAEKNNYSSAHSGNIVELNTLEVHDKIYYYE